MGLLRPGRPGLLGIAAGTAVVAGTAGAVAHHQQKKYAQQDQAAAEQAQYQPAVEQAAPAAEPEPEYMAELEKLAQLKDQGIITEEEFQAKKQQILGL
jgi:membrane protease subunit (stomatin/prohibitin family)